MYSLRIFIFCIIGNLFYGCGDAPANLDKQSKSNLQADTLILLFQKEHNGEVWLSGEPSSLLYKFKWEGEYPLGYLSSYDSGVLPEQFRAKPSYVFPHKPGPQGLLGTCFACRHDRIEAYTVLNLIMKELKRNKGPE